MLIAHSDGFHQDDDISHYFFARDAWNNLGSMLHWWGRPGYNIPTMFAAHFFGLPGCRVFSALQTLAVAWLAYLIARRIGAPPWAAAVAPALVWVQPLTMTLACTTLTETPAAVYMALGTWLYLRGNRVWACAAMSPMFITRIETLALVPLLAGTVVYDALKAGGWSVRRAAGTWWVWVCAAAMAWAPVAYIVAAELVHLSPEASPLHVVHKQYTGDYGQGGWGHFVACWFWAAGAGTLALAAVGVIARGRRAWLPAALAVGLCAIQTLIFHYGLFESGGYPRFMVPVSGLAAALAAAGLAAAWRTDRPLGSVVLAVLALAIATPAIYAAWVAPPRLVLGLAFVVLFWAVLPLIAPLRLRGFLGRVAVVVAVVAIAAQAGGMIRPLRTLDSRLNSAMTRCTRDVSDHYAGRPGLTTHVVLRLLWPGVAVVADPADAIARWQKARPGTLFFWDSRYGGKPAPSAPLGQLYAELERRGLLLSIHGFRPGRGGGVRPPAG